MARSAAVPAARLGAPGGATTKAERPRRLSRAERPDSAPRSERPPIGDLILTIPRGKRVPENVRYLGTKTTSATAAFCPPPYCPTAAAAAATRSGTWSLSHRSRHSAGTESDSIKALATRCLRWNSTYWHSM